MAHECPDCGMVCHCGTDIDDCVFNLDQDIDNCSHCDCKHCGQPKDFCECDPECCDNDY